MKLYVKELNYDWKVLFEGTKKQCEELLEWNRVNAERIKSGKEFKIK